MGIAISKALVEKELDKMKAVLEEGKLPDVAAKVKREMDLLDNTTLHIAITGVSGAGKSSLVNALRGMSDSEEGSAKTGVVETTKEPQQYQHPVFPKVTFWDLPGIGTTDFKADKYLKQVDFSKYDFFIIVSGNCFTENDIMLAHEIEKMKKKFYYVRTKIDQSIDAERRKPNFNDAETLQTIRNYCKKSLKGKGKFFLISNWKSPKYDFPLLQKTLEEDLDDIKRTVLIMALPAFSKEGIERKKDEMSKLIWKLSFLSCAIGVTPIPGLSLVCDIAILISTMKKFYNVFRLDEDSLRRLADRVGKSTDELKSAIKKTPGVGEITTELVIDYLVKSALWVTTTAIELVLDFIPVVGSLVGGGGSFAIMYYTLKSFLRDVVEDAQNVLAKALEEKADQSMKKSNSPPLSPPLPLSPSFSSPLPFS